VCNEQTDGRNNAIKKFYSHADSIVITMTINEHAKTDMYKEHYIK